LPERKRKWKVAIPDANIHAITLYREQYERYLKMHNNTANKDVWRVYDHVAAELFHEMMAETLKSVVNKDLEDYIEKVIVDEF
jgi:hypothetical protein